MEHRDAAEDKLCRSIVIELRYEVSLDSMKYQILNRTSSSSDVNPTNFGSQADIFENRNL